MIIRLLAILLLLGSAMGATITEAEYFINTDPGPGNGIDIPISPGESVSISGLMVPTNLLATNDDHKLFIRYRDELGYWGNTEVRYFFVHQPAPNTYAGRDVIRAEYWFDNLPSTWVDINDDPEVVFAALIPTAGLSTNSAHKFSIRYESTVGYISNAESRYFFIHEPIPGSFSARDITDVEYYFDEQPPTVVDLGDNWDVDWYGLISAAGLTPNMAHKLTVRYREENDRWGSAEARYFFAIQLEGGTVEYFDITHIEYSYDNANPVVVDVTDGATINYAALIPSLGLQTNLSHKLSVRYLDERGYWSNPEARYVFVHQSPAGTLTWDDVSAVEYWIDGGAPLMVDIADAHNVSFNSLVPHYASAGPHHFYFRYVDQNGVRSNKEHLPFFVWTGAGTSVPARLAGAEYFVNVDPGVGNGAPINFPQDGAWDEGDESTLAVLTGLPAGAHLFGIRFRDEVNNWSLTLIDTFVVGPVVVISRSGNDIVLNWTANPDHYPFRVFRSSQLATGYAEIGTSNTMSYTDSGILTSQDKQFYYITVTPGVFSTYRLPELQPLKD
jgi:hypothetical protein